MRSPVGSCEHCMSASLWLYTADFRKLGRGQTSVLSRALHYRSLPRRLVLTGFPQRNRHRREGGEKREWIVEDLGFVSFQYLFGPGEYPLIGNNNTTRW